MAKRGLYIATATLLVVMTGGCSGPLTTREKGGLIGTGLGAGGGATIGSIGGRAAGRSGLSPAP